MKKIKATVVSVHTGASDQYGKDEQTSITVEIDGIVGDRHRSLQRSAWAGNDKQPEGTVRRNERQWSAVSVEELAQISEAMDLTEPLTAAAIGANLCIEGIPELSRLPRGTTFRFPSNAELQVENVAFVFDKRLLADHPGFHRRRSLSVLDWRIEFRESPGG